MVNSRRKGAVGEREFAARLVAAGYRGARRGQQRSGLDQADVVGGPPGFHFEVKRVEALHVWKAMAQARRDAAGKRPVVVTRRSGEDWLAVMPLDEFLRLVRLAQEVVDDLIDGGLDPGA